MKKPPPQSPPLWDKARTTPMPPDELARAVANTRRAVSGESPEHDGAHDESAALGDSDDPTILTEGAGYRIAPREFPPLPPSDESGAPERGSSLKWVLVACSVALAGAIAIFVISRPASSKAKTSAKLVAKVENAQSNPVPTRGAGVLASPAAEQLALEARSEAAADAPTPGAAATKPGVATPTAETAPGAATPTMPTGATPSAMVPARVAAVTPATNAAPTEGAAATTPTGTTPTHAAPAQPSAAGSAIGSGALAHNATAPSATRAPPHDAEWTLPGHYKVGDAEPLKARPSAALSTLKLALRICGGPVVLEGHSCSIGSEAIRNQIGLDRAEMMRDRLVRAGVPTTSMHVVSMGSSKPIAHNDTNAGRAKNRRVTIRCAEQ